jgi:hypothetical protein
MKSGAGLTRKHAVSPYDAGGRTTASRSPYRARRSPTTWRNATTLAAHFATSVVAVESVGRASDRSRERASGVHQALSSQCRPLTWAAGQALCFIRKLSRGSRFSGCS